MSQMDEYVNDGLIARDDTIYLSEDEVKGRIQKAFDEGKSFGSRSYAAAQLSRMTNDWASSPISVDQDIRIAGRIIRERARDLAKNNDYGKEFIRLMRVNIVGENGFQLEPHCGEYTWKKKTGSDQKAYEFVEDELANAIIRESWEEWCEKEFCSINGQYTFRGIQDLLITYASRDGEGPLRFITDPKSKFGMRLQVVPPEMIDDMMNVKLSNGNVVKMGVELDDWKRPLNYNVFKYKPELELWGGLQYSYDHWVIPASEMILAFDREYENQTRGLSWMVQSMFRLKMLSGYEEAAITNARIGASKMGFFVRKGIDNQGESYSGQSKNKDGSMNMEVEAGLMQELPAGMEFQQWDPDYPTQQHPAFMKTTLRGIAAGSGVSYESLTGDLEGVNYSSIRDGKLKERDWYKLLQVWFIESYMKPVFTKWLEMSILSGAVKLPMSKFAKFNHPKFIGRRWDWVDPLKDIEAEILEIQSGLDDPFTSAGERGRNLRDIYKRISDAKALAKEYGLNLKLDEITAARPSTAVANAVEEPVSANPDDGSGAEPDRVVKNARELISGNGHH